MPLARRPALLVAGGVVVLGVLGVGATTAFADGVARGTRVAGTDVGGLSRAEATARLQRVLDERAGRPVVLDAAGEQRTLDPAGAGLGFDVDATVDRAADSGPADRLAGLFGADRQVEPVTREDPARLRDQLTRVAATVDRAPVEGAVTFAGLEPVPVLPVTGRTLQVDAAADAVRAGWLGEGPVPVPVTTTPVRTTEEQVRRAVDEVARPAVAAPVTLDAGGVPLVLAPEDLARATTLVPGEGGALAPVVDGAALLAGLGPRAAAVSRPAQDASFDVSGPAPVLVPAQEGRSVDPAVLASTVAALLPAPAPRSGVLPLQAAAPALTTERAQALGINEVIGSFTTRHPCCAARVTNIHTIADIVDGHLVLPGETYSLNGDVGARDRRRGFVEAPQILEGQFVDAVGGGVSQFATTMYNAAFFGGLEDVEHKPHSYYISRYPEGREATVSTPAPDLKWRNDSDTGVLVTTSYTGTSITVTLWGTKRYDEVLSVSSGRSRVRPFGVEYVQRADCTSSSGANGFDITITRVMKKGGAEVRRTSASHRYLPEPRFVCGAPPRATPAPAAPAPAPAPVVPPPPA